MFCRNCGNQIPEGTKFCNNCGMAQEISQSETQDAQIVQQEEQPKICKNCGIVLKDGVKFCSECGTAIESMQDAVSTQQVVSRSAENQNFNTDKSKKFVICKGFIGGIVMSVFGFIGIYGGVNNGMFEKMSTYGADLSNIVTVLFEVSLIIGGILLAYNAAKRNNK